ncbi:MAG TPA: cytochrome c [Nitrospiria bacterium]|nr:cytochrome c [Nitrospiria bacterium]
MNKLRTVPIAFLFAAGLLASAGMKAQAGDLEAGKKVYDEKKCSMCHRIDGKGGKMGPDLSFLGDERERGWIADYLKDPKGTKEGSKHKVVKVGEEDFNALVDYLASLKKG